MMKARALGAVVLLGTVLTSLGNDIRVEILDYGLYSTGTVFKTETLDGIRMDSVSNLVMSAHTNVVEARMGDKVGFRYAIHSDAPLPRIWLHVIHPPEPITDPELGVKVAPCAFPLTDYPTNSFIGYSFDHKWECVEGKWVFLVGTQQQSLARKEIFVRFLDNPLPNKSSAPISNPAPVPGTASEKAQR